MSPAVTRAFGPSLSSRFRPTASMRSSIPCVGQLLRPSFLAAAALRQIGTCGIRPMLSMRLQGDMTHGHTCY
jgi:hypothetical protein